MERAKGRFMERSGVCCVLSLFFNFPLCRSRSGRSSGSYWYRYCDLHAGDPDTRPGRLSAYYRYRLFARYCARRYRQLSSSDPAASVFLFCCQPAGSSESPSSRRSHNQLPPSNPGHSNGLSQHPPSLPSLSTRPSSSPIRPSQAPLYYP